MNDGVSIDPDAVRGAAESWLSVRDITLNANSGGMRYPSTTSGARQGELSVLRLSEVLDQVDDSWADKCQSLGDEAIDFHSAVNGYVDSIERQDVTNAESLPRFPDGEPQTTGRPDEPQP